MSSIYCRCQDCSCKVCDFEECDCESCEVICGNLDQSTVEKRRTVNNGDSCKLYGAILTKDKSTTINILQKGDVNLRTVYNGNRALHLVFKTFTEDDVIEILPAFIARKVNLYFKNNILKTILHIAVENRWKKAIDFMLRKGYEIEMIYKPSNPVTHFIVEMEHRKFWALVDLLSHTERREMEKETASFIEWLISKGFDFDRKIGSLESALFSAIERNLQHILPTLLKHSRNINYNGGQYNRTLLHTFVFVNDHCKGNSIRFTMSVYSMDFAQRYTSEIIKTLLDKGVDVDAVDTLGNTVLHDAIRTNVQMGIFEMLLDHFTNVHHKNQSGRTALHEIANMAHCAQSEAEAKCYVRIMQSLIAKGSDVNSKDNNGSTPVYEVVVSKNLPAILLMSENNADFNVARWGQSLLHGIARKLPRDKTTDETHEVIFDLLIDGGCDVNTMGRDEESPLHLAAKTQNIIIMKKLLAHGADVNHRTKKKQMASLHFALGRKKAVEGVKLLIDHGANIHAKTVEGLRPIHYATTSTIEMVKILLKCGSEYVHARDKKGETCLSYAVESKHPDIILELLKYGANINEPCVLQKVEYFHKINHYKAVDPVLQHWIKLEAINLPHLKEYRACIKEFYYNKFHEECLKEIDILKSNFIDNHTTFYKFLQINPNRRCAYGYCEMLQKHVNSASFEQRFPNYYILIIGNYRIALMKNSLMNKAKQAWQELTQILLPDICLERIISFLNIAELIEMVEND